MEVLFVGLGGAIGAILRYLISLIIVKSDFPVLTFITNFLGSFIIGFIAGIGKNFKINQNCILFLKTGFCGGFTTFSTFSLENLSLLKKRLYLTAGMYSFFSLILCVCGAALGEFAGEKIKFSS